MMDDKSNNTNYWTEEVFEFNIGRFYFIKINKNLWSKKLENNCHPS